MRDGSKIRKMFLETRSCRGFNYVVPTENESLMYYGPDYFGDGISWAILSKGDKELVRWNLQYVMSIVWE